MVIHPMKIVCWISIVVIHIFKNIDAKICKVNNDSATYLWHCRLGHIGVKRMKKLHADGIWNHLIMNHFMLANHALWARRLRLCSPEQWSEQLTYWK